VYEGQRGLPIGQESGFTRVGWEITGSAGDCGTFIIIGLQTLPTLYCQKLPGAKPDRVLKYKFNTEWASSSFYPAAMPWPRLSFNLRRRSKDSKSMKRQSLPVPRPSSSSDEHEDDRTPEADKETNAPPAPDPTLTQLFSDAASYNQILNTHTDVAANDAGDSQAAHGGFSRLIGRDLEDHERVASETLAQLSVSNWAPGESTDLAPDVGIDEPEVVPSEGEPDKVESSGATLPAVEPQFEAKLKPDEILDLLQQDFGALAPPGEEKLLLETDATLFQEVVVLVCQLIWDNP
jgi:hypothetical protein